MYINSRFVTESKERGNWMGETDLLCATDEQLEDSVTVLKEMYDEYVPLRHLAYERMDRHEKLAEGVYAVTYSDGTVITVDYNRNTYKVTKA